MFPISLFITSNKHTKKAHFLFCASWESYVYYLRKLSLFLVFSLRFWVSRISSFVRKRIRVNKKKKLYLMKWDSSLELIKGHKVKHFEKEDEEYRTSKNNLIQIIELLLARAANACIVFTQCENLDNFPSHRFFTWNQWQFLASLVKTDFT